MYIVKVSSFCFNFCIIFFSFISFDQQLMKDKSCWHLRLKLPPFSGGSWPISTYKLTKYYKVLIISMKLHYFGISCQYWIYYVLGGLMRFLSLRILFLGASGIVILSSTIDLGETRTLLLDLVGVQWIIDGFRGWYITFPP